MPAPPAATIPKFTTPLPLPRVKQPFLRTASTDYYASTITASTAQLVPGHATAVVTYDGAFDTEYIRARSGRRVVVLQGNSTATPASVHLHGGHTPTSSDGAPMDTIAQGQRKTYVYENDQPAATLWRHDHAHHHESESVYRGQASTYVVTSPEEDRLNLPSGRFEVPLVLRDAHLDGSGQLVYVMDDAPGRSTILVNGAPWPVMAVAARRYRFRVVNASNMRFFALGFTDGRPSPRSVSTAASWPRRTRRRSSSCRPANGPTSSSTSPAAAARSWCGTTTSTCPGRRRTSGSSCASTSATRHPTRAPCPPR